MEEVKPITPQAPMEDKPIMHKMVSSPSSGNASSSSAPIFIALVLLIVGVISGFFLSRQSLSPISGRKEVVSEVSGTIKKGQVYGAKDEKAFRDKAEGTLEKGGLDGEGSHKLIREGGESQTAYVTSSTLDLDQFVGRKVKVWGETYKAQRAGWFMDVGRVEVLE